MMCLLVCCLVLAITVTIKVFSRYRCTGEITSDKRILVVTGCDSGIGHALALSARTWGCTVIGTCVEPFGRAGDSLRAAGVFVVKLDLTKPNTMQELLNLLKDMEGEGKGLWCLVNNAGVMTYAACEWHTDEMVAQQIQVNLTGCIQVTAALLPMIRRNKGRIVVVSSPTGQVACPNMAIYSASKFGLEGFAQALRREMQHHGVQVSVVRPCNLPGRTCILKGNAQKIREMLDKASQETKEDYEALMQETETNFANSFGRLEDVVDIRDSHLLSCFRSAVLSTRPQNVYAAAPLLVKTYLAMAQTLPTRWVDFLVLNGYHAALLNLAKNG